MKKLLLFTLLITCVNLTKAQTPMTPSATSVTAGSDWSTIKITADGALDFPWEITYGPDDNLWVTERVGEKISRVSTATSTNTPTTMLDLSAKITNSKQGGLMGMAIHPALYTDITTTTNNYVFVSYTYTQGGVLKLRIARLIYNNASGTLSEDTSLNANGAILEGLPGSSDHNSGRLIFGPDTKLYYTIGDQGANQFENSCNPVLSQVLPTTTTDYDNYPGKTLRINIDGSIPTDNPTFNSVQSHVYTYGHRNAQGIIFAQDGSLYNSEHGAKVDDELNKVIAGKNYGWPEIAGYYDNRAYTYCNWSSAQSCDASSFSDHNCPNGVTPDTEFASFPVAPPSDFQPPIGTYNSTTDVDPLGGFLSWPTIAPSSIDIHETGNIPCWDSSLLIPSLKRGTIFRAQLTPDGNDIVDDFYEEFHSSNDRYRDVAISPDGLTIYAVTDNSGGTSGPSSGGFVTITNPGVIIKIEYSGPLSTTPITAPTLEDVVSLCPITLTAPVVMSNNCVDITGTTTDPTTYSSGTNIVQWSFDDNGTVVTANQNVIINTLEAPSNIIVMPSSTTAEVSWDELDNTTFQVRYRVTGTTTWLMDTTTTSSITLTGLTLNTNYDVQVQSDCGATQSAFSPVINFSTVAVVYCDAQGVSGGHINNVLINGDNGTAINNTSSGDVDYTDFTSITPVELTVDGTTSYSLSVSTSYSNGSGVAVWIDINQDGDFDDADEKIWDDAVGTTGDSPRTNTFILPNGTLVGTTTMRVASRQFWTPAGPCGDIVEAGQDSEVEDYSVTITTPTLSVQEFDLNNFVLFPNPTSNSFTLKMATLSSKDLTVKIMDIQGRIVKQKTLVKSSKTVTFNNLSNLTSGVYFVSILDNTKLLVSKKLVKL